MARRVLGLGIALAMLASACGGLAGESPPAPAPSTREPAPPGFPLLGSWVTTITPDDVRAGGFTDRGIVSENSGRFTWTFDTDATWHVVQVSLDDAPILNPVFGGTFRVDGDTLIATTEFPEQYRDSGIRYTWTIQGDGSVRFDVQNPPDPVFTIVTEAHPWHPAAE